MRFTRSSGILLHPISLPGPFGSGDLGASSYHFIDWLSKADQSLWQMLPMGPVGLANSPYMSLSAFAGNPLFIDLYELVNNGWLTKNELDDTQCKSPNRLNYLEVMSFRINMLKKASERLFKQGNLESQNQYKEFYLSEKAWLDDYALFQALNHKYDSEEWTTWDHDITIRDSKCFKESLRRAAGAHRISQIHSMVF
jgi:4-alpha-glucanotransferase